jgi:beta-galactosidase
VDRVEDVTKVTVYSNQPKVELFANGVSLGVKEAADHFFYFDVPNVGETTLVAVAGELKDEGKLRKVEKFNEAYRLREKSAILNWFDITEVEGHLSLNSKFSEIMGTLQGKMLVAGLFAKMAPKMGGGDKGPGMDMSTMGSMMDMLGGFTFIRLAGMLGSMNINFTKEELLEINAKLNKIKKPRK